MLAARRILYADRGNIQFPTVVIVCLKLARKLGMIQQLERSEKQKDDK